MVMPRSTSLLPNDLCKSSILSASLLSGTGPLAAGAVPPLTGCLRQVGAGGPARSAGR
jgi:hypothetical protein